MAVNASIHIFPRREMTALDMAEVLAAALVSDGIIQGCSFSRNANDGTLSISDGRIVIRGRLGVIDGGVIEVPSDATGTTATTRHVVAACNLMLSEPFYLRMLSNAEYTQLTTDASEYTAADFNVRSGVRFIDFGTATVASGKVTAWTPVAATTGIKSATNTINELVNRINNTASTAQSNIDSVASTAQTNLNNAVNTINTALATIRNSGNTTLSLATLNSWKNYLAKRAFAGSKLVISNKDLDGIVLGGNKILSVQFKCAVNSDNILIPYSSTDTSDRAYIASENANTLLTQKYNEAARANIQWGGMTVFNDGHIGGERDWNPSVITANDQYGVPTTIDTRKTPLGIVGITINNASSGGANYANCLIQAYGFSTGDKAYVRIRNIGSAAAKIRVIAKILYVQNM